MSKYRSVLRNAGWSIFGTLVNIAIAFLLTPLLIENLGADQWGLLLLIWSFAGVLGLANFGLVEATLRYVAHYHADHDLSGVNRVFGATLTFYVSVCALICGVVWATTPVIAQWIKVPLEDQHHIESLLRLAALLYSAGTIANAFHAITLALQRYDISNGIVVVQGIVRSVGLVALVLAGSNVLLIVIWDVLVTVLALVVHILVARRLLPGLRCLPSMSLAGMREILHYSTFSFMTQVFLTAYREGGKLILGNQLGTASVAYLGAPDGVAVRIHMIVISAIETLVPRFAASRDADASRALLLASTWAAVACVAAIYVPLAVLMPDFLRLWINPEFAHKSGAVGQLLVLGLVGSVAFAPIATLFRGMGNAGFVSAVMAAAGIVVLVGSLLLVPSIGVVGVGYAYFLAALPWLVGLCLGWMHLHGRRSWITLLRVVGLPLTLACCLGFAEASLRNWWGEPGWVALITMGASFFAIGTLAVLALDLALGGVSPAKLVVERVLGSGRMVKLRERAGFRRIV